MEPSKATGYHQIMGLIARMDNWTLVVCIALATSMSAFAFGRTWKTHRSLRGSGSFALAFLFGTISCILFTLVPDSTPITRFLNIVVGDTLVICVYALLLMGVEQFFGARRVTRIGWLLVAAAFLLVVYFTEIHDSVSARILVNDVCVFAIRVFIGVELLRHAGRRHLRTLSGLMFLYALLNLYGIWDTIYHQGPRNAHEWMLNSNPQQLSLLTTLIFFIAIGQLLLLVLNGELMRQLEEEATKDFMTGTLNRRGSERALTAEMARSQRYGLAMSIALLDVDQFKQINDSLGHAEGDRTLILVAKSIESSLRAYDSVGRFGGDEFLIIMPNTPAEEALTVMERLRAEMANRPIDAVALSIGVTCMASRETNASLLARVDEALYQAKQDGRNCTRLRLPAGKLQTSNARQAS
jgi:diguanylate cyclase (GGDEF)-like protein